MGALLAIILLSWFGGVRYYKGIPAGLVAIGPALVRGCVLDLSFPLFGNQLVGLRIALTEDGVLVQFTYGPSSPVSRRILQRLGLEARRTSWVVENFPPASVWRYRPAVQRVEEKRSA